MKTVTITLEANEALSLHEALTFLLAAVPGRVTSRLTDPERAAAGTAHALLERALNDLHEAG